MKTKSKQVRRHRLSAFAPRRWASRARRLARASDGGISIEFAFLLPMLAALLVGAVDFGRLGLRYSEAKDAAAAAIQFATQNQAHAVDTDGLRAAALAESSSPTMTVDTPAPFCQCTDGSPQSCSDACPDGDYAPMYLRVTVHDTVKLMFDYPGLSKTQHVDVFSEGRIR